MAISRLAKVPVSIPKGVELKLQDGALHAKGPKGSHKLAISSDVEVSLDAEQVKVVKGSPALVGTTHVLIKNLVRGVHEGFKIELKLVGVGYKAKVSGKKVELNLGFSHPVHYDLPEGISAEATSATDLILSGYDKQLLGQVAANIRAIRPPDAYKGKGVRSIRRYGEPGERIVLKEAKKKGK